jgi:hypothetical protein
MSIGLLWKISEVHIDFKRRISKAKVSRSSSIPFVIQVLKIRVDEVKIRIVVELPGSKYKVIV